MYTLFSIGRYVKFDIFGQGDLVEIDWIEADKDAFLVDLRDGFPKQASGKHLFGSSEGPDGDFYENGFEKLATSDSNKAGFIEGEEQKGLALWKDNGDAKIVKSETIQLAKKTAIPVRFDSEAKNYGFLNMFAYAEAEDGQIYIEDIWFMTSEQPTEIDRFVGRLLRFLG